jgi:hypothetical protein
VNSFARNADAAATVAISATLVLALPASDWSLRARLAAFAAIAFGVPTVVCATTFVFRRMVTQRAEHDEISPRARP